MKKVFGLFTAALLLTAGASSCTKCIVCKNKTSSTFEKVKYCDKDYDKGDIDQVIEDMEDDGYSCHAESMIL